MWKKINHGGEPTKNIDKKYAIFVGRYQPNNDRKKMAIRG